MPTKLFVLSGLVGLAASVPIIHQTNPQLLEQIIAASTAESEPETTYEDGRVKVVYVDKAQTLQGRKVRIQPDQRGHYQTDFKINGTAIEAMIDTGATLVALNYSTARRIGVKLQPTDFIYEVQTANGVAKAASTTLDEIQIGKIFVRDVKAAVLEDKALNDTLIGMSFLNRISSFRVEGGGLMLEQ